MGKLDKFCQSCGMPMDKDPGNGETKTDGTKKMNYCSYCYQGGKFNDNFTRPSEI